MVRPSPEQHRLFIKIENRVKWAVAKAYRDGMLAKQPEHEARWSAIHTMCKHHPELDMATTQSIVAYIIMHAAQHHKHWMQGGAQAK